MLSFNIETLVQALVQAGEIVREEHLNLFGITGAATEYKADGTPISRVDRHINETLKLLAEKHGLGYVGEEGNGALHRKYVLYVDPIDGTVAFLRGMNTATIIATVMEMQDGVGIPLMSVIYEPLGGHCWLGEVGQKTRYKNMHTGDELSLTTSPEKPERIKTAICIFPGASHNLAEVSARICSSQQFDDQQMGAFGIGGGMIASGLIHGTVIGRTAAYESAAMSLIVRGAGGVAYTLEGQRLPEHFTFGEVRGKPDFELPDGAIFAANDKVFDAIFDEVLAANHPSALV